MGNTFSFIMESSSETEKFPVELQTRSEGDGMENVPYPETSIPIRTDSHKIHIQTVKPKITDVSLPAMPSMGKRKEPKFVPYEPYKAAVSPIVPPSRVRRVSNFKNLENTIVNLSPVSKLQYHESSNASEFRSHDCSNNCDSSQHQDIEPCLWLQEKVILENKIASLIEEKKDLEKQFTIQTKVNADLKKLLVASLGEDIQAKVQYMTEDKAKLGEHVLFYSEKLNQNSEELDKLSVQCDIWKSKFEASSLLVQELANWKVVLTRTLQESFEATQCLLNEHKEIHKQISETFSTLLYVQEAFDPSAKGNSPCPNSRWNLHQLSAATRSLSEDIQSKLLGNRKCVSINKIEQHLTRGEEMAINALSNMDRLPELAKLESMKKTLKRPGSQACSVLPHNCNKESTVNCCKHCSGEIRLV